MTITASQLRAGASSSITSPNTTTFASVTNGQIDLVVNGVTAMTLTESGGTTKVTVPHVLDPIAYVGTVQSIAQRDALVATSPLTKAGYLVYVDTGATKQYQVWSGTAWEAVGGGSIADWSTATAYAVGNYVNQGNRLYKCLVAHTAGTFATDLTAASWVEVANQSQTISPWSASTVYKAGDLAITAMGSLIQSNSARTSNASFGVLEAGNWTFISASSVAYAWVANTYAYSGQLNNVNNQVLGRSAPGLTGATFDAAEAASWYLVTQLATYTSFTANAVYVRGTQILVGGVLYERITTGLSGATFDVTEQANWRILAITAAIADWATATAYLIGDYVNSGNRLYKCLVAHTAGTFATDLGANNWVEVSPAGGVILNWAAATAVTLGEQRLVSIGGASVVIRSLSTRTTTAAFDATEAADWTYMSQSFLPAFPATTLVITGFQFREAVSGLAWQSASIRTTGATFSPIEQAFWQGFTPYAVSNWATTTVYGVGQQVIYAGQLLQCLTAHTSVTVAADAANWLFISPATIPSYTATTYYFVGSLVSRQDAIYRRTVAGVSGATFDVTEAVNWTALTASKDVQTLSADTTLTDWDQTIIVNTGNVTITLPTAVGNAGKTLTIHRIGGTNGYVTFATSGAENLDGASPVPPYLAYGQSITVMSDGVGVQIVDHPELVGAEVQVGNAGPNPYYFRRAQLIATGAGPFTVANPALISGYPTPYTLQLRNSTGSAVTYTFASKWVDTAGQAIGSITLAANSYRLMLFMGDVSTDVMRLMVDSHAVTNLYKGSLANTAALIALAKASLIDGTLYAVGLDFFVWRPAAASGAYQPTDTVVPGVDAGWWVKVAGRYAGLYSSTDPYNQYDVVLHAGEMYFANFSRDAGVWGASPTVGVGAASFTKLPGVIKPQFTTAQNYAVGDLVYDGLGLIGALPGIYKVDVAYTAGNLQDADNFSPILVRSIYRGVYGSAEYLVGDVVTYDNKFYTCGTATGSNNLGGPFDETKWTPTVYPKAEVWVLSTKVGIDELRTITLAGVVTYIKSNSARTTGAGFDATEAANWTYVGQAAVGPWVTAMLLITGFQLRSGSLLYASTSNRLTGATFDDTEKAFYTILNPIQVESRTVTADYTVQAWDEIIYVDSTSADVTITLPNTLNTGKKIVVHKLVAANNMIVAGPNATGLITSSFAAAASESFAGRYTNVPYIYAGTNGGAGYWHIYA